jgi:hypothetical protein
LTYSKQLGLKLVPAENIFLKDLTYQNRFENSPVTGEAVEHDL